MDPFQALCELPKMVEEFKRASAQLAEAQRELDAKKSESYVSIDWVASLWSVSKATAYKLIKILASGRKATLEIKVLSFGKSIVRYRRSDIERISQENLVPLKDMLARKQAFRDQYGSKPKK